MDQNPPGFANEDEEATYCLSLLRDGDRQQKIVARERLSQIFEQRGLLDEAAQCLESNIREGIRDPRVYQRLAGVYRRQGRHELADEVLLEARRLAERMSRGPQQPGRRGAPGRPQRSGPPPTPGVQETATRQLPTSEAPTLAATAPAPDQRPADGGEFGMDQPGDFGGPPRIGEAYDRERPAGPPPDRPWWLSPAMVVVLILLCGPFGLAMMWVRGDYPVKARKTAIGVWAGLMVLFCAAGAIYGQQLVLSAIPVGAGLAGVPRVAGQPTPIVFPPVTSGQQPQVGSQPTGPATKPVLPAGAAPGAVPSPPTVPGTGLGTPSAVIAPAGPAAAPGASPVAAEKPSSAPTSAPKPAAGAEKVKVINTGDQGANMRQNPGSTAPVIRTVPDGAVLEIAGADQQMDGRGWRNVKDEEGKTGWIAGEFLEKTE